MFRRDYCTLLGQQLVQMCHSYSKKKKKKEKKIYHGTGMYVLDCHKGFHFFFPMHTYV